MCNEGELKKLKGEYAKTMDDFRQIIGERDILEDKINKQKRMIKELEDEKKSLRVELEIISSSLIVILKEN